VVDFIITSVLSLYMLRRDPTLMYSVVRNVVGATDWVRNASCKPKSSIVPFLSMLDVLAEASMAVLGSRLKYE
jgi:hypothetical protein